MIKSPLIFGWYWLAQLAIHWRAKALAKMLNCATAESLYLPASLSFLRWIDHWSVIMQMQTCHKIAGMTFIIFGLLIMIIGFTCGTTMFWKQSVATNNSRKILPSAPKGSSPKRNHSYHNYGKPFSKFGIASTSSLVSSNRVGGILTPSINTLPKTNYFNKNFKRISIPR